MCKTITQHIVLDKINDTLDALYKMIIFVSYYENRLQFLFKLYVKKNPLLHMKQYKTQMELQKVCGLRSNISSWVIIAVQLTFIQAPKTLGGTDTPLVKH